jgi:hypothetical protein
VSNLIRQQWRRDRQFERHVADLEAFIDAEDRDTAPAGRRIDDDQPAAEDVRSAQVWPIVALLAVACGRELDSHDQRLAAERVLSWHTPLYREFLVNLDEQIHARDDGNVSVERSARAVGIAPRTAREWLMKVREMVESEWLDPLDELLARLADQLRAA